MSKRGVCAPRRLAGSATELVSDYPRLYRTKIIKFDVITFFNAFLKNIKKLPIQSNKNKLKAFLLEKVFYKTDDVNII